MPQIYVTVPANSWNKEAKEKAATALTDALAQVTRDLGQEIDITPHINVFFNEASEGGYVIGGKAVG